MDEARKVRVLTLETDGSVKDVTIPDKLEEYQAIVGGYIESFGKTLDGLARFCNEDGARARPAAQHLVWLPRHRRRRPRLHLPHRGRRRDGGRQRRGRPALGGLVARREGPRVRNQGGEPAMTSRKFRLVIWLARQFKLDVVEVYGGIANIGEPGALIPRKLEVVPR